MYVLCTPAASQQQMPGAVLLSPRLEARARRVEHLVARCVVQPKLLAERRHHLKQIVALAHAQREVVLRAEMRSYVKAGGGVVRSFVARGSPAIAAGLSHRIVSLLDACLALEPERRPTAAALLEHPWFDPTAEAEDEEEAVVYRSMSDAGQQVEELEGADALPPPPLPSRQAAFKGEHWE